MLHFCYIFVTVLTGSGRKTCSRPEKTCSKKAKTCSGRVPKSMDRFWTKAASGAGLRPQACDFYPNLAQEEQVFPGIFCILYMLFLKKLGKNLFFLCQKTGIDIGFKPQTRATSGLCLRSIHGFWHTLGTSFGFFGTSFGLLGTSFYSSRPLDCYSFVTIQKTPSPVPV